MSSMQCMVHPCLLLYAIQWRAQQRIVVIIKDGLILKASRNRAVVEALCISNQTLIKLQQQKYQISTYNQSIIYCSGEHN